MSLKTDNSYSENRITRSYILLF